MNVPSDTRKVAIITGASQGIGAGLVAGYRRAGYAVVGVALSMTPSDEQDRVGRSSPSWSRRRGRRRRRGRSLSRARHIRHRRDAAHRRRSGCRTLTLQVRHSDRADRGLDTVAKESAAMCQGLGQHGVSAAGATVRPADPAGPRPQADPGVLDPPRRGRHARLGARIRVFGQTRRAPKRVGRRRR